MSLTAKVCLLLSEWISFLLAAVPPRSRRTFVELLIGCMLNPEGWVTRAIGAIRREAHWTTYYKLIERAHVSVVDLSVRLLQLMQMLFPNELVNLIIDDTDHSLIIKVASIQQARMQIYFIDNEDYFHRKYVYRDKNNVFFEDNDERAIFYARGVIETVKKLGWSPDIVHCHGWMSALTPLYIKKVYHENPLFSATKVIMSIYDDDFSEPLHPSLQAKLKHENIAVKDLKHFKKPDFVSIMKASIDLADGVIIASQQINSELSEYIEQSGKPILPFQGEDNYIQVYNEFYEKILHN